jgi:hypothetical protein
MLRPETIHAHDSVDAWQQHAGFIHADNETNKPIKVDVAH